MKKWTLQWILYQGCLAMMAFDIIGFVYNLVKKPVGWHMALQDFGFSFILISIGVYIATRKKPDTKEKK